MIWLGVKSLHVLFGAFWLGGVALVALLLLPAIRAAGPAGGAVMSQLAGRQKLHQVMSGAAMTTILTGVVLLVRLPGASIPGTWTSPHRLALLAGMLCGLSGFLWGLIYQAPRSAKLGALTAKLAGPPTPQQAAELGALQAQLGFGGRVVVTLLVLAVIGMACSHAI